MPQELARAPDISLAIPEEHECGEAMRALTVGQRGFVVALLDAPTEDNSLAALRAGYGGNKNSAGVASFHMMRNQKVIAAIREEADRRLRAGAILGAKAVIEIAADSKHKDRFKAAVELMNRAGLLVETRHHVIVDDNRDTTALKEEVAQMLGRLFQQPVLPAIAAPMDAEFVEVDVNDISDLLGPANGV